MESMSALEEVKRGTSVSSSHLQVFINREAGSSGDSVSEPKRKALDRLVTGHNAESGSVRAPKMRRAAKAINYLEMIGQG